MAKIAYYFLFIFLFIIISCESKSIDEKKNQLKEMDDPFMNLTLPNILHLDDSNYTSVLKNYEQVYLLFYSSQCNQCSILFPKFNETANYFKEKNINVKFFKINGPKCLNASIDFVVITYPNIIFINKGERHKYIGPKSIEAFTYFMERKKVKDIHEIKSLEELKNIKNIYNTDLTLLSTIKNKTLDIYKYISEFADKAIFMEFASCTSEECINKYGEDIILLKTFDEKENSYKKDYGKLEEVKFNSIRDFVSIYAVEMGAFASQNDVNLWFEFDKKVLIYMRDSKKEEDAKYDKYFKELGFKLRKNNTYVFIMAPDGNKIQAKMFKDLVILDEEMPCIIYYDANSGDKVSKTHIFKINNANMEKIDDKYIFKYLKKIKKRRIKRELFSEYPSKEPKYIKGMKYIIGRDFDKEINDEQNNILLCVYTDSKSDLENNYFNILGNLTEKYQSDPEKKIKFFILNYKYNEPRDLEFTDKIFPKVYLYTNAMKEKKIWRFKPKNETEICYEEMETFLKDKLKWKDEKDKQEFNKDKKKDKSNKNEDL